MNCDYCGAPLTLPLVWRGRCYQLEEGPFSCARPHLCPPPIAAVIPNERWFLGKRAAPTKARPRGPAEGPSAPPPPKILAPVSPPFKKGGKFKQATPGD